MNRNTESLDLGGIYSPNSQYDDDDTLTDEVKTSSGSLVTHAEAHTFTKKLGALLSEPTASSTIASGVIYSLTPPPYASDV